MELMANTNPAQRYIELQAELKALESEKELLRLQLIGIAVSGLDVGPYVINVSESTSDRLEGLNAIKDKSRSLYDALHTAGCVKSVVSTRLTVKAKLDEVL
jgi:hypothetical protein